MAVYLSNAFSLSMVSHIGACNLSINSNICNYQEMVESLEPISIVGHQNILCRDVPMNRVSVTLNKGDTLIVGQYSGARLPEGTSVLPEGASITWMCVHVE